MGGFMRGAIQPLSRLNATRMHLFAVAVFGLCIASNTGAQAKPPIAGPGPGPDSAPTAPLSASGGSTAPIGQDDSSVAYAVPRNAPAGNVEIVLPEPLLPSAVAMYQRILALQDAGDYASADQLITRLDDTTLVGPLLAARYLSPGYHASTAQLLAWYEQYNNQPEALDIFNMLAKRLPRSAVPLPPAVSLLPETTISSGPAARPVSAPDGVAWRRLFMLGLADWQRGDISDAGDVFIRCAQMPGISQDDAAAGAFWAARAALREEQPESYLNWLHQAASSSDTFYGMLAGRLLGQGFGPTGIAATLTEADITAVDATPDGHLAFALLQIGEADQAATALRGLWPDMQSNADLANAVMAVAARAGLADVTIGIAARLPSPVDEIAGARLPLPALHPTGGFTVDPALVYALARTESGFNTHAISPAGARGLMQLMPVTARYIGNTNGIAVSVNDPSQNLALGQAYLHFLGSQAGINNSLLPILAGYNAGPNAVTAWFGAGPAASDPLIFIENIPNNETRRFVRQVLADSWLYAEEIGLKPKSLDDLAEGNYPLLTFNTYADAAH
jgi:soluble lytic murein transglycosylase-like protein